MGVCFRDDRHNCRKIVLHNFIIGSKYTCITLIKVVNFSMLSNFNKLRLLVNHLKLCNNFFDV